MGKLTPIEFKNQRIITTKVLAEEFGTEEKNIQMNFSNNIERFKEGKHFIELKGQALKDFKNSLPNEIGEPLKFAPKLILWTDRGAARHAKILDTDEAWEVYENLEENYFNPKKIIQLSPMEQLKLQYTVLEEHEERVTKIEGQLERLEVSPSQRKAIQSARHKRVSELLGGKKAIAYKDSSFRGKVYSEMGRAFNNYFDVPAYDCTPKNRFKEALELIGSYNLSVDLSMELKRINNQVNFEEVV
jgi:ORF6C domain/ORF6N domain